MMPLLFLNIFKGFAPKLLTLNAHCSAWGERQQITSGDQSHTGESVTGRDRCLEVVDTSPAGSHEDCHPGWGSPCPAHRSIITHRQPAHTRVLQEVAVQPNPLPARAMPTKRAKHIKISNSGVFTQIWRFFPCSLSQKPLRRTVQGVAVEAAHPTPQGSPLTR